jgi:hypothetical protein
MFSPDFGRKRVTRATGSNHRAVFFLAQGIAALNQVIRKYPVNGRVLIETILNQLFKIRCGLGCIRIKKSDRETALLPVFTFSPLNIENRDRIRQTGNRRSEQDRRQD